MKIGATPRHTFTVPFSTGLIKELKITYAQDNKTVLEKYLADCEVEENSVSYSLTQEETLKLADCCEIEMQIRLRTTNGEALASQIIKAFVEEILKDGVI